MEPIGIPEEVAQARLGFHAHHIGPPPGITDEECGTVEALVGSSPESYPMICNYWKLSSEELEALNNGGCIELVQYSSRMVMHSMAVWPLERSKETKDH